MVNRTRVEGGGYSKHDIIASVEVFVLCSRMWITADFRLYPPVITANQELVSPTGTGDHRYRGGTERAHPRGFRV